MSRALLAAAFVAALLGAARQAAGQPPADAERILVMPFESDRADTRAFWLGEGAAVLLAEDLRAIGGGAITREERSEAFERLQVPQAAALTEATIIRLGQLVGAAQVITGSLSLDGERLTVTARRIALGAARVEATASERGPLDDLFAIVERLARTLSAPPVAPGTRLGRRYPPVAAFELYIKGLMAETPVYAVNYLSNAIKQAPDFDRARLALWSVYNDLGDHEHALTSVEPVPAGSEWGRRARFAAGLSQLGLERFEEAFDTFSGLAGEDPTAAVLNDLGVVQLRRPSLDGHGSPASFFTRAADADPEEPDYRFNAGYAYWRVADWASAVYWLREALRRSPADADAHFVLSAALESSGDAAEAARERELAARLSADYETSADAPDVPDVPGGLERIRGVVELPRRQRLEAILQSSDARQQQALVAEYLARARRLAADERDREALAALERVLFVSPYDADANLLAGRVHLRNGRPREAIDALKISIWSRETAEAHLVLAQAYLESKDTDSAATEAERALAIDPTMDEARQLLTTARSTP